MIGGGVTTGDDPPAPPQAASIGHRTDARPSRAMRAGRRDPA
jgi:hypothetical protein